MIQVKYIRSYHVHSHTVQFEDRHFWVYPTAMLETGDHCVYYNRSCSHFGKPPSAELRSLIEAGAPWYAVMDKLSEEYPQWQHHFDEAIRRHQAEQPASELRANG